MDRVQVRHQRMRRSAACEQCPTFLHHMSVVIRSSLLEPDAAGETLYQKRPTAIIPIPSGEA